MIRPRFTTTELELVTNGNKEEKKNPKALRLEMILNSARLKEKFKVIFKRAVEPRKNSSRWNRQRSWGQWDWRNGIIAERPKQFSLRPSWLKMLKWRRSKKHFKWIWARTAFHIDWGDETEDEVVETETRTYCWKRWKRKGKLRWAEIEKFKMNHGQRMLQLV